ncbi:hypothetical protein [Deinococcus hopiensis]|uniref:hypothetical protein n=1 Tax=Deinococcus hopiensis TaxID=309885 RepID=UPI000A068CDC|nr:hypothetical protein [Deinococcus hopiensis]
MTIKDPFHTADHGTGLRASLEALCGPDVFGLKEGQDHQRQQFHLVLAQLREGRREAAGQFGEDIRRRALFSRA